MMMPTPPSPTPTITSTRNRRIVEVRKLAQRKHRERQGRFAVEGLQLLHMALDAGCSPIESFYCPEMLAGPTSQALVEHLQKGRARPTPVSSNVMQAISDRDAPQGIVTVFPIVIPVLEDVAFGGQDSADLVVVVDRLQDPGNLGTLIRTADAVGARAVVCVEPCVDAHDPKTVRSTMGSLFNLPVVRAPDVEALFALLHARGMRSVGADVYHGNLWGEGTWRGNVALVMGNEARGLSDDVRDHIQAWCRLPMVGKAESLNVAIAGGILMYAWLRENLAANN